MEFEHGSEEAEERAYRVASIRARRQDLEDRTFQFAKRVRQWIRVNKPTTLEVDDVRQLIRASGLLGSSYVQANESLSRRDFLLRIKVCCREAKVCGYWLRLMHAQDEEREALLNEAGELLRIFGAILRKSTRPLPRGEGDYHHDHPSQEHSHEHGAPAACVE